MNFRLIGEVKQDLLETIFSNRGITNIDKIIKPDNSDNTNPLNLVNIKAGIELIKENLSENILIIIDSDIDGNTSGAIMYKTLRMINPFAVIDYYIHKEKQHGFTNKFMEFIKDKNYKLIIVPDAGTNDIEQIEKLEVEYNMKVLVIDHHEVNRKSDYGIIVNNQISENVNKNLTGAGVTYLFCYELMKEFNVQDEEDLELRNLAMIGQIGDSSDLLENEVRNLCLNSIKNIKNNFVKRIYENNEKDIHNLSIKDLSFGGIIPMINAVARVGTLEEKEIVFEALADIDIWRTWIVTKRKLNKESRKFEQVDFDMDLYDYAIEICTKARDKQNKISNNVMKLVESQFNENSDVQIYIIDMENKKLSQYDDYQIKGVIGLIAMKLADNLGKPTIVCWYDHNEDVYIGSLRGNEKVLPDFNKWCKRTELFELVQGHPNAAGIKFKKENLEKIIKKSEDVEATGLYYDVDYIFNEITSKDIFSICDYSFLWNNGVKEPLFAIKNIVVPSTSISWSKNTLRVWYNGITFIKFKTPETVYNDLIKISMEKQLKLDIIGMFSLNEWNNRITPQVMIQDFEIIQNNEYGIFS